MAKKVFDIQLTRKKGADMRRALKISKQPRKILEVGIMAPESLKTPNYGSTANIFEVAVANEYGTMTQPARSWLRDWFNPRIGKIKAQMKTATMRVIFGEEDERGALEKLGRRYKNQIKKRIKERIPPPNSELTLFLKDGDTPLIDTKEFFKAIKFRVRD